MPLSADSSAGEGRARAAEETESVSTTALSLPYGGTATYTMRGCSLDSAAYEMSAARDAASSCVTSTSTASKAGTSSASRAAPSSVSKSSTSERLPRFSVSKPGCARYGSPPPLPPAPACSILTTSAPWSASIHVAYGPAMPVAISSTRMPARAPAVSRCRCAMAARGASGRRESRLPHRWTTPPPATDARAPVTVTAPSRRAAGRQSRDVVSL
mmetsp:Transcript_3605/g.13160  ORF Transcript_3605/g.13160 Transcript_3605/m.13160 type:complete len:214 (+) Transcript_3605:218-859(+)